MTTVCCVCHKTKSSKGWVKKRPRQSKRLSHGYCPECYRQTMDRVHRDFQQRRRRRSKVCMILK